MSMTDTRDEAVAKVIADCCRKHIIRLSENDQGIIAREIGALLSRQLAAAETALDNQASAIVTMTAAADRLARQLAEAQTISKQRLSALEFVRSERDKLHHKLAEAQSAAMSPGEKP